MREIKFRGKYHLLETDERIWIYGCNDLGEIVDENDDQWRVDESTIGQWTGLKDDNGVKIYEGDVVSCNTFRGVVKYNSYTASFQAVSAGWWPISLEYDKHDPFEVIGNIFDNPEFDKQFGEVYRKEQ